MQQRMWCVSKTWAALARTVWSQGCCKLPCLAEFRYTGFTWLYPFDASVIMYMLGRHGLNKAAAAVAAHAVREQGMGNISQNSVVAGLHQTTPPGRTMVRLYQLRLPVCASSQALIAAIEILKEEKSVEENC